MDLSRCTESDDDINYSLIFDVYYISADTDSGTAYLEARRFGEPPDIHAEIIELTFSNHERNSWTFSGQDSLSIRSLSRLQAPEVNIIVRADDGLMQIAIVDIAHQGARPVKHVHPDTPARRVFSQYRLWHQTPRR